MFSLLSYPKFMLSAGEPYGRGALGRGLLRRGGRVAAAAAAARQVVGAASLEENRTRFKHCSTDTGILFFEWWRWLTDLPPPHVVLQGPERGVRELDQHHGGPPPVPAAVHGGHSRPLAPDGRRLAAAADADAVRVEGPQSVVSSPRQRGHRY